MCIKIVITDNAVADLEEMLGCPWNYLPHPFCQNGQFLFHENGTTEDMNVHLYMHKLTSLPFQQTGVEDTGLIHKYVELFSFSINQALN